MFNSTTNWVKNHWKRRKFTLILDVIRGCFFPPLWSYRGHTILFHPPKLLHLQLILYQSLYQASAVELQIQFCHQIVSVCNLISCGSGVLIDDRIYLVIQGPHQFPDAWHSSVVASLLTLRRYVPSLLYSIGSVADSFP